MDNRPAPGSKFTVSENGANNTPWSKGSVGHVADHEEDERYFGVVINGLRATRVARRPWGTYFIPIKRKSTIII